MRAWARRAGRRASCLIGAALAGCGLAPTPGGVGPAGDAPPQPIPPPGYGTLSERDISVSLASGDLRLVVTPLHESVIVVTSPDTYQRLHALAASAAPAPGSSAFLVSFHADRADARFVPEEVQLVSGGVRARPAAIEPLTPTWGEGRVRPRGTASAVYTFDRPVDMESDVVVLYGLERTDEWSTVLARVQAERRRAWARAGTLATQSSRSYFEILR